MSGCAPPIFYLFIFYISFLYFLLVSLPLQFLYLSIFYFASISTTKLFPFLISQVYFLNWMTGKRSIEFVILILVNAHKIQKNKQNTENNNKYAYRLQGTFACDIVCLCTLFVGREHISRLLFKI